MEEKRLRILYCIPRSGSTPIGFYLADHFKRTEHYTYLSEYFSIFFNGTKKQPDGRLTCDYLDWQKPNTNPLESSLNQPKLDNLMSANGKYFFKLFPNVVSKEIEDYLFQNSEIIFLKRRNLFENYLSFLISESTGVFYSKGGLNFENGSVLAEQEASNLFIKYHSFLLTKINDNPRSPILFYEDIFYHKAIVWNQREILLDQLTPDLLTGVQNRTPKIERFSNKTEVISWYKNSILQDQFSINL